jgi:O-antigen/teichoic acid export membrane protein
VSGSPLRRLIVHVSHYSLASLLTTIAGLISFPFLTRVFSVADYGAMNLIAATLTIAVAVGKVGVQFPIFPYHSEIASGKRAYNLDHLYSTTLYGMGATGLAAGLLLLAATFLGFDHWFGDIPNLRLYFTLCSVVCVSQVLESAIVNFVRARQLTVLLMVYQVVKRYAMLGLVVTGVLFVARSLTTFYTAMVLTEVSAMVVIALLFFRKHAASAPKLANFSRPLYFELLRLGVPMMIGYELSGMILAVGDRYVIEHMLGDESLGLYAAAYNLCQYVQAIVISSVGQAIIPMYMQMWEQKGRDETAAFISRSLRTYCLFAAPVVAGVAAVGPELLQSLASEKYADAATILPWVMGGMVIEGVSGMVAAGLFIHRKVKAVVSIIMSCAVLNIGLNVILIPHFGVVGAAIATLVAYAALVVSMALIARRLLPVKLPWASLARSGAASAIMFVAVHSVYPGHRLVTLAVRVVLGSLVYTIAIVAIDGDARQLARKLLSRLRRRSTT